MLKHHDLAMTYELENSGDSSFQNLCVLRTHGIRPGTTWDPQNQKGHVIAQNCFKLEHYTSNFRTVIPPLSTYQHVPNHHNNISNHINIYQHFYPTMSIHFRPFISLGRQLGTWKTRASAASRRRSPKSSSKGPMESTDRQSSVRTAEIPRLNHTQMLHVWYIYLQNWVIYVGQMLGFIFQHHGAYGILNHTKPWFRLGVENMNRWIGDWDSPVMAPSYLTKL